MNRAIVQSLLEAAYATLEYPKLRVTSVPRKLIGAAATILPVVDPGPLSASEGIRALEAVAELIPDLIGCSADAALADRPDIALDIDFVIEHIEEEL